VDDSVAGAVPSNSGTSVLDLLKAYQEIVGHEVVAAAKRKLPAADRAVIEATVAVSWVPVAILGRFIDQIAAEANLEAESLLDQAVRLATKTTFKTVWRLMLRLTSDEAILARTPLFWSKSRNVGRLSARIVASGRAEVSLTGWPGVSKRQLRTLAVSMTTLVELCGRRNVRTTYEPTHDGAVYHMAWRSAR
jgi:hypothetical protein